MDNVPKDKGSLSIERLLPSNIYFQNQSVEMAEIFYMPFWLKVLLTYFASFVWYNNVFPLGVCLFRTSCLTDEEELLMKKASRTNSV